MNKLILASNSPRRKNILEKYNIELEIANSDIEESIDVGDSPEQAVMALAFQKAIAVFDDVKDKSVIVAADTVVVLNNKILGKPIDKNDAKQTLTKLSNQKHRVLTGFCLIQPATGIKIIDYGETNVYFNELSADFIESYLKTDEYKDKAGSYGIQGYGELLVDRIEGSYSNVVGLPIEKIGKLLRKHFDISLL